MWKKEWITIGRFRQRKGEKRLLIVIACYWNWGRREYLSIKPFECPLVTRNPENNVEGGGGMLTVQKSLFN